MDERCPVCGKKILDTWHDAAEIAKQVRHRRHVVLVPYWDRRCRCFHAGAPRMRLTKRLSGEMIGLERSAS